MFKNTELKAKFNKDLSKFFSFHTSGLFAKHIIDKSLCKENLYFSPHTQPPHQHFRLNFKISFSQIPC